MPSGCSRDSIAQERQSKVMIVVLLLASVRHCCTFGVPRSLLLNAGPASRKPTSNKLAATCQKHLPWCVLGPTPQPVQIHLERQSAVFFFLHRIISPSLPKLPASGLPADSLQVLVICLCYAYQRLVLRRFGALERGTGKRGFKISFGACFCEAANRLELGWFQEGNQEENHTSRPKKQDTPYGGAFFPPPGPKPGSSMSRLRFHFKSEPARRKAEIGFFPFRLRVESCDSLAPNSGN